MTEIIAHCGLDCGKCRAYIATKTNDRRLAGEIVELWSNAIEDKYTVMISGVTGVIAIDFTVSALNCPVRICANGKKLVNCGEFADYFCDKLEALYESWVEFSPAKAQTNIRKQRIGKT